MHTLYADTVNGLSTEGDDRFLTAVLDDEEAFFNGLKNMKDNDYLKCENISDIMLEQIKREYKIN